MVRHCHQNAVRQQHFWFNQKNLLVLAPMADLTDQPFSHICRKIAGKDLVIFKEMLSAEALFRQSDKTWKMADFKKPERPMVIQIFGGKPDVVVRAAQELVSRLKPDGLDINMGCPVPKISGKSQSGAYLLKDHKRAVEIVSALKKANLGLPVSVKTRLGWSKKDEILDFAPRLADAGADLITIHGRTKTQGYAGKADWDMIGQVVRRVTIPVIANGDIKSLDDAKRCCEITGARAAMIGRAALGNPWVFTGRTPTKKEFKKTIIRHAKLHIKRYGERGIFTFRKHLLYYFRDKDFNFSLPQLKKIRVELTRVESLTEIKEVLGKV